MNRREWNEFKPKPSSASERRYLQWLDVAPPSVAEKLSNVPMAGSGRKTRLMRALYYKARNSLNYSKRESFDFSMAQWQDYFWFKRVHKELQELGVWLIEQATPTPKDENAKQWQTPQ